MNYIDAVNGGLRTDTFSVWSDGGIPELGWHAAYYDIDPDAGGSGGDARTIMWNNGAAENAVVTVDFVDGTWFKMQHLPDAWSTSFTVDTTGATSGEAWDTVYWKYDTASQNGTYRWGIRDGVIAHTPTPAAAAAGLAMFGGLVTRRRGR